MSRRTVAVLLVLTTAAVGGGWWGWSTAPSRVTVRVDGNVHDGSMAWEQFLDIREQRFDQREVHVVVDGQSYAFPQEAVGYSLDRGRLTEEFEAERNRGRGLPWGAKELELPLVFSFDEEKAREALASLNSAVRREPVDAQVLVREHQVIQAEPGFELDVDATVELLRRATPADQMLVNAAIREIPPRVTDDMVLPIDVSKVLATFETDFAKKAGPRAVNIARAARYLDQTILAPGEVFSFNKVVGERSHERGFIDAPVIVNDEMEKDVGGGVCQVASTLHAAAVYGNLEIIRRRSHSRPSGYAPLGLDATVIDGLVDLRIKNTYDTPILIHAYLPSQYVIRVELLGIDPHAKVEHKYTVTETKPFSRRIWHRPELSGKNTFERKQEGSRGYEVESWVTIRQADGKVERRKYPSRYYPVPEVYWVSPGFDLTKLPPLPEGVTEVVVDGGDKENENEEHSGETFDVL